MLAKQFPKYAPKSWCKMVMNAMVEPVKHHLKQIQVFQVALLRKFVNRKNGFAFQTQKSFPQMIPTNTTCPGKIGAAISWESRYI